MDAITALELKQTVYETYLEVDHCRICHDCEVIGEIADKFKLDFDLTVEIVEAIDLEGASIADILEMINGKIVS